MTVSLVVALGVPFLFTHPVFAATASSGSMTNVEDFIRSVIKVLAGLAGLIATGFFVFGGFGYIMSTGNPERLDKAKHTLLYSAVGLTVIIAAFVISNIVTTLATNAFGS
jgi:O-antigen/teichoic acid export membrane protein